MFCNIGVRHGVQPAADSFELSAMDQTKEVIPRDADFIQIPGAQNVLPAGELGQGVDARDGHVEQCIISLADSYMVRGFDTAVQPSKTVVWPCSALEQLRRIRIAKRRMGEEAAPLESSCNKARHWRNRSRK